MTIMMTRQTKTQTTAFRRTNVSNGLLVMALMKTMQTKVAMTMMKTLMHQMRPATRTKCSAERVASFAGLSTM